MCLKSKAIGVTKNLFQFKTTQYMLSPFEVMLLEFNALSYYPLARFYELLEEFFWDTPQLRRYGPLDGLHTFKTNPLDDPWEKMSSGARSDK